MSLAKTKTNCHSEAVNILYISSLPPPYGGIASWTENLIKRGLPYPFKIHLVNTRLIDRVLFDPPRFNFTELKRNINILWELLKTIRKEKINLIHLNSSLARLGIVRDWLCTVISSLYNITYVIHLHIDVQAISRKAIMYNGKPCFYPSMFRRAGAIIVLNNQSREAVLSLGNFENKTFYLPNFIDVDSIPKKVSTNGGKFLRAIFVGALTEPKGVFRLLKILRKTSNVRITFIGKPSKGIQERMERLVKEYGICKQVILKGLLPNRDVLDIMSRSDFFIFPSSHEGFPISVAEAMAVGLPFLASPAGAIPDMVEDGKGGYIIGPDDIEGYAKAVELFWQNRNLLVHMGKYNHEKARVQYDYPIIIDRLCKLYRTLLGFH